jgi:CBS domain-containing protein
MICPDCHTDNIDGVDTCVSCGADLRNLDLPSPESEFEEHLMSDPLAVVGSREAPGVSPRDPVYLAIHIMQRRGVECVLVWDDDEVVGILTERDILMKAAGEKIDLNAVRVADLMTPEPVIARDSDTLAVALHKMSVGGFRHIPLLTSDGDPSVVSIQDVFRHISHFIPQPGP